MDSYPQTRCIRAFIQTTRRTARLLEIHVINRLLIFLIVGLRPFLGPAQCRYEPSCGKYALEQLQKKSTFKALWIITKRLISCNPLW